MNVVVVDFAKNRIKQLESEIADLKIIIIEFGGKNERHTKSINPVFIQAAQEEDRGFEIHRGFVGSWHSYSFMHPGSSIGIR
jgi:hypothetical protein